MVTCGCRDLQVLSSDVDQTAGLGVAIEPPEAGALQAAAINNDRRQAGRNR